MRKIKKIPKATWNRIIDSLIHPHFKEHPITVIVDGLLHTVVEKDPKTSLKKFIKYNVPELIDIIATKDKKLTKKKGTDSHQKEYF